MERIRRFYLMVVGIILISLVASNFGFAETKQFLVYITNPVGTPYYAISIAQSQVLKKNGINVLVQPTTSTLSIPDLVAGREADLGLNSAQTLSEAYSGEGDFNKPHPSARVIMVGEALNLGILARKDKNINSIPDLMGKRFMFDYIGATNVRNTGILELKAYGLDAFKDTVPLKGEFGTDGVKALIEGRADAAAVPLDGPMIEELKSKTKVVLLPFDPGKLGIVQTKMPGTQLGVAKGMKDVPDGTPLIAIPAVFWGREDLDEGVIYQIVKSLIENQKALIAMKPTFAQWNLANAVLKGFPVPYHRGAIKYYTEQGVWKK